MNVAILQRWIESLTKFNKDTPSYLKLKFPMRVETSAGQAYSPFGVLCDLHAAETGNHWEPTTQQHLRLRDQLTYLGASFMPPEVVEEWLNCDASILSSIMASQDGYSFEGAIKRIEEIIKDAK